MPRPERRVVLVAPTTMAPTRMVQPNRPAIFPRRNNTMQVGVSVAPIRLSLAATQSSRPGHCWSRVLANNSASIFANALNSNALPLGSSKNIVYCSPGCPSNRT